MSGIRRFILPALAAGLVTSAGAASAGVVAINFDVNAVGNPINAPATFDAGNPLTNLYAPLGVTFSGPAEGGGDILNDSTFTTKARSGSNFLAFSGGSTAETITFSSLMGSVSIFASSLSHAMTFTMQAFGAGGAQLGTATYVASVGSPTFGGYSELALSSGAGIKSVRLSVSNNPSVGAYVFDDLSATTLGAAVPEPAAWGLMILGFGLAGVALRHARVSTGAAA